VSPRHVHYLVTHIEEGLDFSEEVRDVILGGHEGHAQFTVLDALANEVVASLDVLGFRVVFRIVVRL